MLKTENDLSADQAVRLLTAVAQKELHGSSFEQCKKDVQGIIQKIENGYYASADFVPPNIYHHQSKTTELYQFFSGYYQRSLRWQTLLNQLPKEKIATTIDLCPGWSPKIEFALRDWDFRGKLFLLDIDPAALQDLQDFLDIIKVGFSVELLLGNFFSLKEGVRADLILANHAIDDLFLGSSCKTAHCQLDSVYSSEQNFFMQTNRILAESHAIHNSFIEAIAARLDDMLAPLGYFACLHYPGKLEQGLGAFDWIRFSYEMMDQLSISLQHRGYVAHPSIQKGIEDPGILNNQSVKWICLQKSFQEITDR